MKMTLTTIDDDDDDRTSRTMRLSRSKRRRRAIRSGGGSRNRRIVQAKRAAEPASAAGGGGLRTSPRGVAVRADARGRRSGSRRDRAARANPMRASRRPPDRAKPNGATLSPPRASKRRAQAIFRRRSQPHADGNGLLGEGNVGCGRNEGRRHGRIPEGAAPKRCCSFRSPARDQDLAARGPKIDKKRAEELVQGYGATRGSAAPSGTKSETASGSQATPPTPSNVRGYLSLRPVRLLACPTRKQCVPSSL